MREYAQALLEMVDWDLDKAMNLLVDRTYARFMQATSPPLKKTMTEMLAAYKCMLELDDERFLSGARGMRNRVPRKLLKCSVCGAYMLPTGSTYICSNCGESSGCS